MKVQLIAKEPKLVFLIEGINSTMANTLRRTAEEVPILAIDTVELIRNDSALYDEVLAHRLGLLPLKMEKTFTPIEECTCKGKGCAKCTASLSLKAIGPCTIYSKDLKGKVNVIYRDMPIVILQKGQELELIAEARLGKGNIHAKFSPGLVYYRQYPILDFKECNLCGACVDACPQKILNIDEQKKKVAVTDILKCNLCGACAEVCETKGKSAIKVSASEDNFIFTIESWGQLSPREIFIEITKALSKNLKQLSAQISKISKIE